MDRRGFLKSLIGGVAAGAAVRAFPFRVFSFPAKLASPEEVYLAYWHLSMLRPNMNFRLTNVTSPVWEKPAQLVEVLEPSQILLRKMVSIPNVGDLLLYAETQLLSGPLPAQSQLFSGQN
jgi:hypothetical protein